MSRVISATNVFADNHQQNLCTHILILFSKNKVAPLKSKKVALVLGLFHMELPEIVGLAITGIVKVFQPNLEETLHFSFHLISI